MADLLRRRRTRIRTRQPADECAGWARREEQGQEGLAGVAVRGRRSYEQQRAIKARHAGKGVSGVHTAFGSFQTHQKRSLGRRLHVRSLPDTYSPHSSKKLCRSTRLESDMHEMIGTNGDAHHASGCMEDGHRRPRTHQGHPRGMDKEQGARCRWAELVVRGPEARTTSHT